MKVAFVTAGIQSVNGSFVGLGGADAVCQWVAESAGLASAGVPQFMAWLSDSTANVIDRIPGVASGTFVNTLGEVVTEVGFGAGQPLKSPVHYNENGTEGSSPYTAYSGTTEFGVAAGNHCTDWTIASGSFTGVAQASSAHSMQWTNWGGGSCSGGFRLICMEAE